MPSTSPLYRSKLTCLRLRAEEDMFRTERMGVSFPWSEGVALQMSIQDNIIEPSLKAISTAGLVSWKKGKALAKEYTAR